MGAGGHFVNVLKKSFVLIWNCQKCHRKWVLDIQNSCRQPFCKKITKIKVMVLIWYGKKWFLDIKNGYRWPFLKQKEHLQKSWASDLNNVQTDCWLNTTWYKFTFGQYIYRQVCCERGNIHSWLCSPFRANAHNSSYYHNIAQFLKTIIHHNHNHS